MTLPVAPVTPVPQDTFLADPEAYVLQRFRNDVARHEMTVLHDEPAGDSSDGREGGQGGRYRHLSFRAPGTNIGWFEIVTWPGALTIRGDMGTYTFARNKDMFDFFGSRLGSGQTAEDGWQRINASYWAEKVTSADRYLGVKRFDADHALDSLLMIATDWCDEYLASQDDDADETVDALTRDRAALLAEVSDLAMYAETEESLRQAIDGFLFDAASVEQVFRFEDAWEYDLTTWTYQYLWCLYAITWGITRYREAA